MREREFHVFREGQTVKGTVDIVREGDVFQVFEPDGEQVYFGKHFLFKAVSNPFEADGNKAVNFEEVCN